MINITPYQILVYNDSPQLFLAKDQIGANYLCMAIESESQFSEYFTIPISFEKLNKLIKGEIDLRTAFSESEIGIWYKIIINEENNFIANPIQFEQVDEKYLPLEGFYFPSLDITVEESFYADDFSIKVAEAIGENNFINSMRKSAVYFTLKSRFHKFGNAVNPKDAVELLNGIAKSYKEYCRNSFYNTFNERMFFDVKKLETAFNGFWEYINLRICDLHFSSFSVGLNADMQPDRTGIDSDFINWKKNIVDGYKTDVIENDFLSEENANSINEKYPNEETRKKIFEPLIKVIDNPQYEVTYRVNRTTSAKPLRVRKEIKNIILPEVLGDKKIYSENKKVIQIFVEVSEDEEIQNLTKKELNDGLLFSQITNEFPFRANTIKVNGYVFELKEPLTLYIVLENGYYNIKLDALNINLRSNDKTELINSFFNEFLAKFLKSQGKDGELFMTFKKLIKDVIITDENS